MAEFQGFTGETIDFLWELRMNNSKEWMDLNRQRYKEVLKEPFDLLARGVTQRLSEATGEELHWAVSRINRDIRYSKDKSPYRDCRWLVVKEPMVQGTGWKNRPSFYFELGTQGYDYGMGFYEATPAYMKAYRQGILDSTEAFTKIIKKIDKDGSFQLTGEDYKKIGNREALPSELRPWFVKKSFAVLGRGGIDEALFTGELMDLLVEQWKKLLPLQDYLRRVKVEE